MEKKEITREEWLQHAIFELDAKIFMGELDSINHKFQINCGRVKNNKMSETVQPTAVDDLPIADFFPTTLSIDWKIKDPITILAALTYECIKAFMDITKGKEFHATLEKYLFEKPYNEPTPSALLKETLQEVYEALKRRVGDWPGKAVVFPTRNRNCNGPNKVVFFCPECGFELYTTKNKIKKGDENKYPTCICGSKMARAEEKNCSNKNGEEQV